MRLYLNRLALAPHASLMRRALVHRGQRQQETDRGVYGSPEPGIRVLLSPATAGGENLREDQPSAAVDMLLQIPAGSPARGGDRWTVTGRVGRRTFTRVVQVVRVLSPRPHEVRRRLLCMDVSPNPDRV